MNSSEPTSPSSHSDDPAPEITAAVAAATPDAPPPPRAKRHSFGEDFRRFFVRGLAALLPTLITLWLLFWVWSFLWENMGRHIIWLIKWIWSQAGGRWFIPYEPAGRIRQILDEDLFLVRLLGVGIAIVVVYLVGMFVGNLIGRKMWQIAEAGLMKLPLIRAIYPSVKQVSDFLLNERKGQFKGARVVAVQARAQGVWAIGLVTGAGYGPLNEAIRGEMVTVFIPSSPTAVAGYVVVAHKEAVVELPLTVEEALRLLVSGGVIVPQSNRPGLLPPEAFGVPPAPGAAPSEPPPGTAARPQPAAINPPTGVDLAARGIRPHNA